jgi:hypothetical protein
MTTKSSDGMLRRLRLLLSMNDRNVADHNSDKIGATSLVSYCEDIESVHTIIL